jgi:hypothetical protein
MVCRARIVAGAALLTLACLARPAIASAAQFKIHAPGATDIYLVDEKGRRMIGTVRADGQLELPVTLVDRDTDVEVVLESAPGRRSLALVERGQRDSFCQDESPAGSRCRYTGTFFKWGRLNELNLAETGEVTVQGATLDADADDDDGMRWGVGWLADADYARAFVSDADRVCREAQGLVGGIAVGFSCGNDSEVNAWSADVGVTFVRFIALKAGYMNLGRIDFDLAGVVNGDSATVNGHFGRIHGATFTGVFRVDLGPVVPFVEAGAWRWTADAGASVSVAGGTPIALSTSRSVSGWNPIVGAGVEFWPARYVGLSAGFRLIPVREDLSTVEDLIRLDDSFKLFFIGLKLGVR